MKKKLLAKAAALTLGAIVASAMALPTHASPISLTVDGVGAVSFPSALPVPADAPNDNYPGDTVEILAYSGFFDPTLGTQIKSLNEVRWTIDYTYGGTSEADWTNPSFAVAASRNIQLGTASGVLSQNGQLDTTWYYDSLSIFEGLMTTLFVDGYKIDIIPLALLFGQWEGGQPSGFLTARFVVSEVPIPAALPLLAAGLGGLGWLARRQKRRGSAAA